MANDISVLAPVGDEAQERLHPIGIVVLQRRDVGQRFRLRAERRVRMSKCAAPVPALAAIAGLEEGLCRLGESTPLPRPTPLRLRLLAVGF